MRTRHLISNTNYTANRHNGYTMRGFIRLIEGTRQVWCKLARVLKPMTESVAYEMNPFNPLVILRSEMVYALCDVVFMEQHILWKCVIILHQII